MGLDSQLYEVCPRCGDTGYRTVPVDGGPDVVRVPCTLCVPRRVVAVGLTVGQVVRLQRQAEAARAEAEARPGPLPALGRSS